MAIDKEKIFNNIVRKLPRLGISVKVENKDSQTVEMIKIIVDEIVNEIVRGGEVIVIRADSIGIGNMGAPVNSKLMGSGRGIIR